MLKPIIRKIYGRVFAVLFALVSLGIVLGTFAEAINQILVSEDLFTAPTISQIFIRTVSNLVVALTIFELAIVIDTEFSSRSLIDEFPEEGIRHALPRFIGTIACALTLEGLVLIIKYNSEGHFDKILIAIAVTLSGAILLGILALSLKLHPASRVDTPAAPEIGER
ncbi:hypothetical protein [Microbulbifer sp.]|uniref:hypothetical protein n=1 Tax=Microbulbifer sp. TaxID=1908541 RepID=UPI002F9372E0